MDKPSVQSSLWAIRLRIARCNLPGAKMKASSLPPSRDDFTPAWSCSQRGLPGHTHCCACRWSLTPPFHHDPRSQRDEGCLFLWPCSGRLPRPGCYPTLCSLECGLSSTLQKQDRDCPTSLRIFMIHAGCVPVNGQTVDISRKDIKIGTLFTSSRI